MLLKPTVPGSSFAAMKTALARKHSWSGEVHYTARNDKIVKINDTIELLTAEGSRYALENGRVL
jgi:hypothetical protein